MAETVFNKVVLADGTVLIDLTGDNVTPTDVINGKKFHKNDGTVVTGTCDFDVNSSAAGSAGVTVGADFQSGDILAGKKAYLSGKEVTGSMVNQGAKEVSMTGLTKTLDQGYYATGAKVVIDSSLVPAGSIVTGATILGVEGTYPVNGDENPEQNKVVTPTTKAQTVSPSADYTCFKSIKVNGIDIKVTESANATGKTATIGLQTITTA